METKSNRIKNILCILLAVMFLMTVTVSAVSASVSGPYMTNYKDSSDMSASTLTYIGSGSGCSDSISSIFIPSSPSTTTSSSGTSGLQPLRTNLKV